MTTPDPAQPRPPGTLAQALAVLGSTGRYFKARAELATIEAKEAGVIWGLALALAAGALVLVFLGYVFLVIAAVFGVAALFENQHAWIAVLGVAALIHIAGAVMLVLIARKRVKIPVFQTTLDELKKDKSWLNKHPSKL